MLRTGLARSYLALACAGASSACVVDDEARDLHQSTTEAYISAPPAGTPPSEIIDIERTDGAHNFTLGFKVRDNLAVGPYLQPISFSNAANERIEYRLTPASSFKSVAADHNVPRRPYISTTMTLTGLAVYNLDETATSTNRLDTRSAALLTSATLECWGYKNVAPNTWERRSVRVTVTAGAGDELTTSPVVATSFLETSDVGVPCITTSSPRLLSGLVKSVDPSTHVAILRRAGSLAFWFDGLENLASMRLDTRVTGPFQFSVTPPVFNPPKMCADIPFADPHAGVELQQYPCHADQYPDDGINQMFYIDSTAPPGNNPRLISALSGRCLDIAFGDLVVGRRLQEYDCHAGANQKFNAGSTSPALLKPDSGLPAAPDLCVSVHGGPSTSAAPLEQASCTGVPEQLWTFQAVAHLPPI
jgi:hypothetical protein